MTPNKDVDFQQKAGELAHVVVTISLLDRALYHLLRRQLFPMSDKLEARIFEDQNGPLSTMSARSVMAYGMGLITHDVLVQLDACRTIRNRFAHSPDMLHFQFNDPKVENALKKLGYKNGDKSDFWQKKLTEISDVVFKKINEKDRQDTVVTGKSVKVGDTTFVLKKRSSQP